MPKLIDAISKVTVKSEISTLSAGQKRVIQAVANRK